MKAVTVSEMRSLEDASIRNGRTEESLMDQAGENLAQSIARFFPFPGTVIAYLGKGHNAGDALVALRFLRDRFHWRVAIRPAFADEELAPLSRAKSAQLGNVERFDGPPSTHTLNRPLVLLDALVGIGAKGAPREPLLSAAREMNTLHRTAGAKIAALDLPSGTDPDSGKIHPDSVTADVTFMIGSPKKGLLLQQAADATGALIIVPVDSLAATGTDSDQMISPSSVTAAQQPRPFDFHKGNAGRVSILAGSPDYSGAAVLAATGALRGGAGLITLHVPSDAASLIAAKCPPEIIVRACDQPLDILDVRHDSLVIGCGLHSADPQFRAGVLSLIAKADQPCVIDAEALNLLAGSGDLSILRKNHLLTPHPGEFSRLAPDLAGTPREESARQFAARTASTLLLKGSRTLVTAKDESLWLNPTGTPAMATGGQGDLLSGVIGALLAIGNPPVAAASIGAWICGRAAEIALNDPRISEQSLTPSDVADHLGAAFKDWAEKAR